MNLTSLKIIFFYIFLSLLCASNQSKIVIKSITIRHLRTKDIGLIFDAVLLNNPTDYAETLNFEIRSEKCCLLINDFYDCDTQNIYGSKIFNLEPNKQITVSLLWPTLILFNRIGNCTINAITHRSNGIRIEDSRVIHFNTTIYPEKIKDYMLYYFNDMKTKFGYTKCESDDLNPFDKCMPINCELKYFGKRNFFKYPFCVPVKTCENDPNVVYDYKTNECTNLRNIFSVEKIQELKEGHFDNWVEKHDEPFTEGLKELKTEKKEKIMKRARRSLNESQTFADMIIASMLFIIKIVVLVVFLYLMMALVISLLFYLCIVCGIISNSVTMNAFERFE